ncbi:MAG: hypothetical protein E7323_00160 [Clostridiales bacterium]|nr:hypothetical protein [Clostridiales bacterium]
MRIDLTCPVELWQYAMPTESAAECTFVMNNLSDKVVASVMVTLNCYGKQDQLLFRQSERVQGLKAGVGERFSIVILPTEWNGVEGMDLVVEKVWFDDATIWRRGNAPLTQYTPNTLNNGRALDHLRFVAGRDAVGYPQMQEEAWLCVCGRANALDSDRCCRCERGRDTVFASYNKENVEAVIAVRERKLADEGRKAREDNSRLNEEESKRRSAIQRKRRNRWRLIGGTVAAAAVLAVGLFWGLPTLRYQNARQLMESGQYAKASEAFAAMGTFRDADTMAQNCRYQEAVALQAAGDLESLQKAQETFAALGEYEDSAQRSQQTLYAIGEAYYAEGQYDQAADRFQTLGEYEDSAEKLDQCVYAQADSLFQNGQVSLAQALFATIADYSDAAERVRGCQYALALESEEAGDDAQAAQLYLQAGDYEDAAQRYVQCQYRTAVAEAEAGNMEHAGSLFLACGDYEDASQRGKECIYQYASQQRDDGAYELAASAFRRIPDYEDSQEQITYCVYHQAASAQAQGDYASAVMLLSAVGDYEDAAQRIQECSYMLALDSIAKGDYHAAETLLEGMEVTEENNGQLVNVRYKLAEKAFELEDYQTALDYYTLLNDELYTGRMQECAFKLGQQQMEAALYEDAIVSFTAAGEYEGAATALEEAAMKLAELCESSNDLNAAKVLQGREDLPQVARDKALEILMAEGKRLEDAGEHEAAAAWYQSLAGVGDSTERQQSSSYMAAIKQMQAGEYLSAAKAFEALGEYEDAAAQAQTCYDSLYSGVLAQAETLWNKKDYIGTIVLLQPVMTDTLPQSYQSLSEMYLNACLKHADALYAADDRYGALPFYMEAAKLPAAEKKLGYRTYLILGLWESNSGKQAEFRPDGTCNLMGKELYFKVDNFSLLTGESPEELTRTHRINSMTAKGMSIEELRGSGEVNYKLEKIGEPTIPSMNLEEDVTAPADEAPVTEETDEL